MLTARPGTNLGPVTFAVSCRSGGRRAVVTLGLLLVAAGGCRVKAPQITEPFAEDFDRPELGPMWNNTGADWKPQGGRLAVQGAKNHPLWLRQRLPQDVVVEVDAMSKSPEGDLKIELYGDGVAFDPDQGRYDNTGYIFVFGGWQNSLSIIGRLGEHDAEVKASRSEPRVEPGRVYHWVITKKGGKLDWQIDGRPFLSWEDPAPLAGPRHEYLAFGNWSTDVTYDNLRIRPAP